MPRCLRVEASGPALGLGEAMKHIDKLAVEHRLEVERTLGKTFGAVEAHLVETHFKHGFISATKLAAERACNECTWELGGLTWDQAPSEEAKR